MEYPLVSIMIATYNSDKVLGRTLEAISKQSYPTEQIEILIVDGGSSDATLDIAREYGCHVLKNDKTEPINAKMIGLRAASGKYFITLDHDEVFANIKDIEIKVMAAMEQKLCKAFLGSGYIRPREYPGINEYISEFGDPFSLFIYNFPKGDTFFEKTLRKNYRVTYENDMYLVVSFKDAKKCGIIELCCLGTMIDLEYFKELPGMIEDPSVMVHAFYEMLKDGIDEIVVCKNSGLLHYSADSIRAYLPKLKWRVRNNIHFSSMAASGFEGRTTYQKSARVKKYFFIPYTISTFVPLCHAIYLAMTRKNISFLWHPFFCWYVLLNIVWEYAKKMLKVRQKLTSYDGKKVIDK